MRKQKNIKKQIDRNTILTSMSEGVLAFNSDRILLMVNNNGRKYLNIESQNPAGKTIDSTIKGIPTL